MAAMAMDGAQHKHHHHGERVGIHILLLVCHVRFSNLNLNGCHIFDSGVCM